MINVILINNCFWFSNQIKGVIFVVLHDFVPVTIWRWYDRSNADKCMLTIFCYFPVVFIPLYELVWHSNGSIKRQTLECLSSEIGAA